MSHPITPPPELVRQWLTEECERGLTDHVAIQAARWGSDQELEACCEWLPDVGEMRAMLRAARRPKPPSLKEQALAILDDAHRNDLGDDEMATIRRALKQLPE
jgi:hypothetical protein